MRKDLHPALQYVLLEAASEVHAVPGIFNRASQFPAPETIDLPLSDEARQFYKTGRPWLQRNLPLGLAVFMERLLILLIPIVGVFYPALRLLPPLYAWIVQRRIVRLYGELKLIEAGLTIAMPNRQADLLGRLDSLERSANQLRVPVLFSATLYTLKHHIGLVRERLERRTGVATSCHREGDGLMNMRTIAGSAGLVRVFALAAAGASPDPPKAGTALPIGATKARRTGGVGKLSPSARRRAQPVAHRHRQVSSASLPSCGRPLVRRAEDRHHERGGRRQQRHHPVATRGR